MGWAQAWTDSCQKLQILKAADGFISDLSEDRKTALKDASNAEQRTKEQQELITSAATNINLTKKAYSDSLDLAKNQALKQWETDSTAIADQVINDTEIFNIVLIESLYSGGSELEKSTGLKIKDQ